MKIILYLFIIFLFALNPVSAISQLPDYDFDKHLSELEASNFSLTNLTTIGAAPYEDLIGTIFWGILFALIFIVMWISMEDVTIPTLLGMIIGGSMWVLLPPDWLPVAMSLTVISFAGLVYSILKKG